MDHARALASASSSSSSSYVMKLPALGDSITEGEVASVLKAVGESVQDGDVLAVVETDKVSVDIRAEVAGVVEEYIVDEGKSIQVGEPFVKIAVGAGAAVPAPAEKAAAPPPAAEAPAAPAAPAAAPPTQKAQSPSSATPHGHHRQPLIRFRHGKRDDAAASPAASAAGPAAQAPSQSSGSTAPSYLDLSPFYGRLPPLTAEEAELLESGGASAYD